MSGGYASINDLSSPGGSASGIGDIRGQLTDPFFQISRRYLPTDIQSVFEWCKFYTLTHPIVSAVVHKRSEYPVTDVLVETQDEGLHDRYTALLKNWDARVFSISCLLDHNAFGNCYVSLQYPMRKVLVCGHCRARVLATQARYRFRSGKFHLYCSCGSMGPAKVCDVYMRNSMGIKLLRLSPLRMVVVHHEGLPTRYFYKLSTKLRNDIVVGRPEVVENLPQVFIDAAFRSGVLELDPQHLFHLKRPSISADVYEGLGAPLIFPVLQDAFLLKVLNRAQEAIAFSHIMPVRTISPASQAATGVNPYTDYNVAEFIGKLQTQFKAWTKDPNRFIFSALPFQYEEHGGRGRVLLLNPEIRAQSEQIVTGMLTPVEFIFGGAGWSASNVSLRTLEKSFLGDRTNVTKMWSWIFHNVAAYMGWRPAEAGMSTFKMADDIQRATFDLQLAREGYISADTMLANRDYDPHEEQTKILDSIDNETAVAIRRARAQGDIQVEQARAQQRAQALLTPQPVAGPGGQAVGPDGQPMVGPDGQPAAGQPAAGQPAGGPLSEEDSGLPQQAVVAYDSVTLARQWRGYLEGLDSQKRRAELSRVKVENPRLYSQVIELMHPAGGGSAMQPYQNNCRPDGVLVRQSFDRRLHTTRK